MSNQTFPGDLMELYQGEIIGEVLLDRLLSFFPDPEKQYPIAVMLQLETETKARLRPALMRLGLDIAESADARRLGVEMAEGLAGKGWLETMVALHDAIEPFVQRYQEIAANAPAEFKSVADSMVVHERSLFDFVAAEAAGDSHDALAAIIEQLEHKPPPPRAP